MSLIRALQVLDEVIPDELVQTALRGLLQDAAGSDDLTRIELGDAERGYVEVPVDATLEVVTKGFFKEYKTTPFGDFRAMVAIGGASISSEGVLNARLCFATVFLNANGQRISTDFHLEAR